MRACANISRSGRGGCSGLLCSLVFSRRFGSWVADLAALAQAAQEYAAAVQLADVLRAADAELDQAPAPEISAAVCSACGAAGSPRACVRKSLREIDRRGRRGRQEADRAGHR